MGRLVPLAVAIVASAALLTGCSGGKDAVVQGETFDFVSPGGKTEITYDPPAARKRVRDFGGNSVSDDKPLSLSDFPGQVVVVNVWGQWCGPCRAEVDDLESVYSSTRGMPVAFLGIDFRDKRQEARDYIRNHQLTYPSIFDYPGRTLVALTTPTSVVPTTVVLDRQHRAAAVYLRTISAHELKPLVTRLAAEPAPAAPSGRR